MEFKDRLKDLRREKKLSQAELAQALGYGYTAISNYETGRTEPCIADLIKLARRLNVSVDYLIGNNDER